MLLIRGFEDRVQSLFLRGEVYGTTHLYSGQEAVAVGFAERAPRAATGSPARTAGTGICSRWEPIRRRLLAELLGRATGVNGGLAGSMNVVDPDNGVLGCYGIVGGSIAAATGAALALRTTGGVAVAYFGDGAANQAYFFECLNFAKVLGLPVVFVCENNQYGEYTPTEAVTPGGILPRAAALEIPTSTRRRDGRLGRPRRGCRGRRARPERRAGPSSSRPRRTASSAIRAAIRASTGPEGELDRWKERDPLVVAATRLRDEYGRSTRAELAAIAHDVERVAGRDRARRRSPRRSRSHRERSEFAGDTAEART